MDAPAVAVIVAGDIEECKKLVSDVITGVKNANGVAFTHFMPAMGYAAKINPQSAKFAQSWRQTSKSTATAIIKTNMVESVVIVGECDVTVSGIILACIETNTPVAVLPFGKCNIANIAEIKKPITQLSGAIAGGKVTTTGGDEIISREYMPKRQGDMFSILETLGICQVGAGSNKRGGGKQIEAAIQTGAVAVKNAIQSVMPKKIFTKQSLQSVVDNALANNYAICDLVHVLRLFNACGVETPIEMLFERMAKIGVPNVTLSKLSGTALGGLAYVQWLGDKPEPISGRAWVYQTLEDADRALCNGSIPAQSIIVLQNMVGVDVSAIANVILGMGREREIAIATDGTCEPSNVLCVQLCTPDTYANEEFSNIQNGDELEIDATRGRFNSDVNAKELKTRAKRNVPKREERYF